MKKCKCIKCLWLGCSILCILLLCGCSSISQNLDKEIYCVGVGNSTFDTYLRTYLLQEKFGYGIGNAEDISRTPNHLLPKETQEALETIISYFKYLMQGIPSNNKAQPTSASSANNMYNNCMQNTSEATIIDIYNTFSNNDAIKNKSVDEKLFCLGFIEGEGEFWISVQRGFIDFVNNYGDSAVIDGNVSNRFIDNYISELNSEKSISRALTRCVEYVDSIGGGLITTKLWLYSE